MRGEFYTWLLRAWFAMVGGIGIVSSKTKRLRTKTSLEPIFRNSPSPRST